MYVETVYSASSDNQTISVKVTEQMETKNDAKIQAMKDVISAFVLPGQQGQIEVKCSPAITSGVPNQQSSSSASSSLMNQASSKPRSCQTGNDERITGPQIKLLREKLKKRKISEREFCSQHQVNSIEELPKFEAQWIIKDLCNG